MTGGIHKDGCYRTAGAVTGFTTRHARPCGDGGWIDPSALARGTGGYGAGATPVNRTSGRTDCLWPYRPDHRWGMEHGA